MNIALWIVQGLLALAFVMAGQMPWVNDFTAGTVKVIGAVEVLGAIGLIAPMLTGILPG